MANQPSNVEPYIQPDNPVTRDPLEEKATAHAQRPEESGSHGSTAGGAHQSRPQEGIPSSLGRGVDSSGPVDDREARSTGLVGHETGEQLENENVNAEQMATLGEGEVAGAVARKSGTQQVPGSGPAEEQDFASDLDRKKAEQAADRQEIKSARADGVDVDGGLGQSRGLGNESLRDA